MKKPGKVLLVGAGPGDPDLLTVKAVKALQAADVILADDLASDAVLALASPGARVIHVGKRGGCKSTPQEFIERLMVSEARAGNLVVRLKGGDPFIFGRGGEELEALRAAGIECDVVNGITSGLAAATSVGVPLTHRDFCAGAILVTGHEREGAKTDWRALAATGLPLVIYMGIANCAAIQRELLAGGLAGSTPAVAVQGASRGDEHSLLTTLDQLPQELADSGITSPAILVIGGAASLAQVRPRAESAGSIPEAHVPRARRLPR
ncbi:uroporphyrinogen-III C-methyltransferase [Usitatibacter palustris]|uniref:uroporphyrinogen-III C-methyltransferase n=1 Tax=Usitatibacter palustris TaxID=2732487 RepID=A0A6M4H6J8_9PROT|nr:uroporphyrinogen-III C-methyltransferase [Usitatibacter palustris]QJR14044.1 Uroporphyrinogen-III C-methyltransferase [Usitatibacter palustris]